MLDDVGMHVGNLSLQHGQILKFNQTNKTYYFSFYRKWQHMTQSQHGPSLTSSAALLNTRMQCDALTYLQQEAPLMLSIYRS